QPRTRFGSDDRNLLLTGSDMSWFPGVEGDGHLGHANTGDIRGPNWAVQVAPSAAPLQLIALPDLLVAGMLWRIRHLNGRISFFGNHPVVINPGGCTRPNAGTANAQDHVRLPANCQFVRAEKRNLPRPTEVDDRRL